jgi:hypothetical protein
MALNDEPINWNDFYNAYTGLKFSIHKENDCRVFVPTYRNAFFSLTAETSAQGTEMTFKDEWSSQSFLIDGSTDKIDKILLRQLWEYATSNILWDEYKQQLSFQDIEVEEIALYDFVKNIDSFMVIHKLSKFGDVWWTKRVSTDTINENTRYENVSVSTSGNEFIEFWSPDKWVNDEYKKYLSNPAAYTGFITSTDFINGGWFTAPDLVISTKPFDKLKIADVLLNLNITYDPSFFGHYYDTKSTLGVRIKDETSTTILDESQIRNSQNTGTYSDTAIAHWVGGLINTSNIGTFGELGSYTSDTCEQKSNEINYTETTAGPLEISHKISGQLSLNPNYDISKPDFLGTIDSINWRSAESDTNAHNIGVLNIPRSFGRSSGTRDNGIVTGGIKTDSTQSKKTEILSTTEIWQTDGFLKNTLISLNTPRCFHVQGGVGGSSCAVIGGYSQFNTENNKEFSEYSKSGVLNTAEIFVRGDDPALSYFKTISNLQLNVSRGDGAGYLAAQTYARQDKFGVESLIQNFALTEDDDQIVLDFVREKSEATQNTDNTVRYAVSNITGFVYGGNTSGRSHLITRAEESYISYGSTVYDEIISTYEKINTTNIISSTNSGSTTSTIIEDSVQSVIKDVLTIDGTSETGSSVSLPSCGKYRIEYIDGGFSSGGQIIKDVITINTGDSTGKEIDVENAGKYNLVHLSTMANVPCQEILSTALTIPGWEDAGTEIELPYVGNYQIRFLEGQVEDPGTGGTDPTIVSTLNIPGTNDIGQTVVVETCGTYRITYVSGSVMTNTTPDIYSACFKIYIDGVLTDTIWAAEFSTEEDLEDYMDIGYTYNPIKRYHDFCVDATQGSPKSIRVAFYDIHDDDYSDNTGTVTLSLSYRGKESCPCADTLQAVDVIINDNFNVLAFTTSDTQIVTNEYAKSVMRLRYHDSTGNWSDNNSSYGSVVVEVCYMGTSAVSATPVLNVLVNDITAGSFTVEEISDYKFCVPYDNSKIKLVGANGIQSIANFRLDYLGQTEDCSGGTIASQTESLSGSYSSQVIFFINEQVQDNIFDNNAASLEDLEFYLESRPSRKQYDFCSSEPNSTLRIANPYSSIGFENVRILYLGESNCDCTQLISSQTATTTVSNNEITVSYVSIDSALEYPVRCHGMVYVGNDLAGISTGGRCEFNNIDGVITRLYEKYREGYSHIVQDDIVRTELEKDRILDLVYELKDGTWIRRQNMLEAVYWHCGVGDQSHALFWGGIHNSVGSINVEILNTNPDINTATSVSDFICGDDTKDYNSNTVSYAGKDYPAILSGVSSCWETPTWQTIFTDNQLFNDPRYRNNQETLAYSFDDNFPAITVISVLPTNPAPIAPQTGDESNVSIDHSLGTTSIGISKTLLIGGTFRVKATVSDSTNTTNGTFYINNCNLRIDSETTSVYPSNILSISGNTQLFEFTDVKVNSTGTVEINYSLSESFTYNTNSDPTPTLFYFGGVGILTFNSMAEIYDSIRTQTPLSATSHTFRLLKNTLLTSSELPFIMSGTISILTFNMTQDDGVMVGVKTQLQDWNAQLTDCGPNISNIIQLTANFSPITEQKWGIPIWSKLLIENTGAFNLNYSFDRRQETTSTDLQTGNINHETTTLSISATTLNSILSERLLITGTSIKQDHTFIAMNNISLSAVNTLCETVAASSSMTVAFSGQQSDNEYTEWASSFIQEYQSDQRYNPSSKWVPSNGIGLEPDKNTLPYDISWKRYMDGVGLGGEVPDYDTIYDRTTEKLRNPNEWAEMNTWYIGQMAFGDTNASVVVGGHKVTNDVSATGRYMGYHSTDTTKRTFIWDLTTIPEEDSYAKHYLGRRLFNFYKSPGQIASDSIDTKSSLNVVIFNAESDILIERQGSALFEGNVVSQTIVFDKPLPAEVGTGYSIALTPSQNIKAWWSDKSLSGFTLNVETSDFRGYVDYSVNAIVKVTETDINNTEPLEGYNFEK